MRTSLRSAAPLPSSAPLFLNVHPAVFSSDRPLHETLIPEAERSGVSIRRLVLEITEQGSLSHDRKVLHAIRELKDAGVRFAFDDVGVAYSHLPFLDAVRPSFLKISQHFGTHFETDPTKTKIVRNLLQLARDFECDLILEGIESSATAAAAMEMGIKYGQGYHFAVPADAKSFAV